MDPNATLDELRDLVSKNSSGLLPDDQFERLVELFKSLDGWISNGGFLPADWQNRGNDVVPNV